MASFDLPEIPQPRVSAALLVGVASPLWTYFGAAAASGVAYWWMTRWARPVNLEALMGAAQGMPLAEPVFEPAVEAVESLAAATGTILEDAGEASLEAAPISPLVEAAAPTEPSAEIRTPAPVADDVIAKGRGRKLPPSEA